MDSRTPEEVMKFALSTFCEVPDYDKVSYYNSMIHKLITNQILFSKRGWFVISSDPLEDVDDLVMLRYGCMNTRANLLIIISAGYHTPQERFAHLKKMFPCFHDAEFGVPLVDGWGKCASFPCFEHAERQPQRLNGSPPHILCVLDMLRRVLCWRADVWAGHSLW